MIGTNKAVTEMTPMEYQRFMQRVKGKKETHTKKPKGNEADRYFSRPYQTILEAKKNNPDFYNAMVADQAAQQRGERPVNDYEARLKRFRGAFDADIRGNVPIDRVIERAEKEGMIFESQDEIRSFYGIVKKEIEAERKKGYL